MLEEVGSKEPGTGQRHDPGHRHHEQCQRQAQDAGAGPPPPQGQQSQPEERGGHDADAAVEGEDFGLRAEILDALGERIQRHEQ